MPNGSKRRHQEALFALGAVALCAAGCSRQALPDPRAAAARWAEAAERGDSEAMYGMLTVDARRTYGKDGTRRLVDANRKEIAEDARALASGKTEVEATATVRFADGEQAVLEVDEGEFKVGSAGALPSGARTPAQALSELRQALARRSYAGLMRVLSADTKNAIENDLRSLVTGLEQPETLDVKVTGDTAEVQVPGGHSVRLKRESGVWRIEDFD
jgi:hypothetical protein